MNFAESFHHYCHLWQRDSGKSGHTKHFLYFQSVFLQIKAESDWRTDIVLGIKYSFKKSTKPRILSLVLPALTQAWDLVVMRTSRLVFGMYCFSGFGLVDEKLWKPKHFWKKQWALAQERASFTALLTAGMGAGGETYFYTREIETQFLFGVFPENYFIKTNFSLSIFHPWRW